MNTKTETASQTAVDLRDFIMAARDLVRASDAMREHLSRIAAQASQTHPDFRQLSQLAAMDEASRWTGIIVGANAIAIYASPPARVPALATPDESGNPS